MVRSASSPSVSAVNESSRIEQHCPVEWLWPVMCTVDTASPSLTVTWMVVFDVIGPVCSMVWVMVPLHAAAPRFALVEPSARQIDERRPVHRWLLLVVVDHPAPTLKREA